MAGVVPAEQSRLSGYGRLAKEGQLPGVYPKGTPQYMPFQGGETAKLFHKVCRKVSFAGAALGSSRVHDRGEEEKHANGTVSPAA